MTFVTIGTVICSSRHVWKSLGDSYNASDKEVHYR